MHNTTRFVVAVLFAGAFLPAQDLIGVGWSGQVVLVDSLTAAVTPLGTGLPGQNALGRDASGNYWCTTRTTATPYVYGLTVLDPSTGAATVIHSNFVDLRGLCAASGSDLFGILQASSDMLVRIDTATGTSTTLGSTGFAGLQGLAEHQGVLYGWDINQGLVIIDPNTGAGVDPFPGLGGPSGLQFLCSHPDGRLLAGGGSTTNSLYTVDLTTGLTTLIGVMSGAADLRGLEALGGYATSFGSGCNGAGGPVTLTVTGNLRANGNLTAVSTNHASNALGAMVLGLSTTSHQGLPLPTSLDPILGTSGCTLYTSIDASLVGITSANAPATLTFAFGLTSAAAGAIFHLQHACFEPVAGGLSWSNGVTLHIGM
jgi:hypothetical protein